MAVSSVETPRTPNYENECRAIQSATLQLQLKCRLPQKDIFTVRNEVAKVMFLQVCVCPWGRGSASVHVGIPSREQTPPQQTATAADGTHPTGMHSCLFCVLIFRQTFYF